MATAFKFEQQSLLFASWNIPLLVLKDEQTCSCGFVGLWVVQ